MAGILPKKAIRCCLGIVVFLVFIFMLFAFVGMPTYAAIVKISYAQAWTNLIESIRAVAIK